MRARSYLHSARKLARPLGAQPKEERMRELERQLEAILEAADLEDAVLGNDHGHRWPGSAEDTEALAAWTGTVSEIIDRGKAITDAGKALNRELERINPRKEGESWRERAARKLAEQGEA